VETLESLLYKIIGSNIRKARKDVKMSQYQLAVEAEMSRASISNIELGRHQPSLYLLYVLCEILGIDLWQIIPSVNEIKQSNQEGNYFKVLKEITELDEKEKRRIQEIINKMN